MTIPSIGGNGKNFHFNPHPPISSTTIETEIQNTQINSTNPAVIDKVEEEAPQPSAQTVDEDGDIGEQQVQRSVKKEEKEYSIEQFRKDYQEILFSRVIPNIQQYEGERKTRMTVGLVIVTVLLLLGIFLFIKIDGRGAGDALWLCIAGGVAFWTWLKKSLEKKIKRKVMPLLMQAVPGFYWQETPPIKKEEISKIKIFARDKSCSKSFDDCFVGKYRNVEVLISECEYEFSSGKQTYTSFKGAVIRFTMNKNFEGLTVVRPTTVGFQDYNDLKKDKTIKMEEITLEDPEFSKKYKVYSTDQIESRYLLTTAFMERFKNLTQAFRSSAAFCAFYDRYIYIAPYCTDDLFSLGSLTKNIANTEQFARLFDEFASILEFVDHFKLDKKLGL